MRFLPSAPFDDRLLTALPEVTRVDREGQHVVVTGTGELVNTVILALAAAGVTARDVQLDSSNLEDAFVKLTGKHLTPDTAPDTAIAPKEQRHDHALVARPPGRQPPPPRLRSSRGRAAPDAFGQIVLNEARLTWRRPVGLIGGVALPVLLLVIFGELPSFKQHAGQPRRADHLRRCTCRS